MGRNIVKGTTVHPPKALDEQIANYLDDHPGVTRHALYVRAMAAYLNNYYQHGSNSNDHK